MHFQKKLKGVLCGATYTYLKKIIQNTLEESTAGKKIKNIRFADDTVLPAKTLEDLQEMVYRVVEKIFLITIKIRKLQ